MTRRKPLQGPGGWPYRDLTMGDELKKRARDQELVHPLTCRGRGCYRRIVSVTFGVSDADRHRAMLTFWGPFLGDAPAGEVHLVGRAGGNGFRQVALDDAPDPVVVVCGCGHRNEMNRATLRALASGAIV